jgi:DNA-binding GntR family transcriptional regulator
MQSLRWKRTSPQSLSCHHELVGGIGHQRSEPAETVMRMHMQGAGIFLAEVVANER